MERDGQFKNRVAAPSRSGPPFARNAQAISTLGSRRDLDLDLLAAIEVDCEWFCSGDIFERDIYRIKHIASSRAIFAPASSATPPEEIGEDVPQFLRIAREMKGCRSIMRRSKRSSARERPMALEIFETVRCARVALLVDLAAVVSCALLGIAQKIICLRDFREPGRRVGLVLVAIRMKLFGEFAIGFLDCRLICSARYAEYRIRICH